jgi:hypothetical protein
VRSYAEFTGGHVAGSLNILPNTTQNTGNSRTQSTVNTIFVPLVTEADKHKFLTAQGIECYNGVLGWM